MKPKRPGWARFWGALHPANGVLRAVPVAPGPPVRTGMWMLWVGCLTVLAACRSGHDAPPRATFADPQTCYRCHEPQYRAWKGSHHERAMQPATDSTVLGDFDAAVFTHFGTKSRFFRRGGGFFVNTPGPDGRPADFEIKYTFGIDPLQQYLVEMPGGRLQALTIAWDVRARRWFHLYPEENIEPGDPLHWTGIYLNWNSMCADCHSTDLRKNFDRHSDTFQTTWQEINVGCQACHGPGQAHVDWATAHPQGDAGTPAYTSLVDLTGSAAKQVAACAPCHARRQRITTDFPAGKPLLDHFVPALLRQGLYHPDGQILDEVYVYGSYVQSKMYRAGVKCSNCHQPHSLKLRAEGNALCVQCHSPTPNPRFEGLIAKNYDSAEHHFHPVDTEGARCVSCHMPARTYMQIDPRRDHSFRPPRPDLTLKIGTPNACNACHTDQTEQWARHTIEKWYGKRKRMPHFGEAIAAGRSGADSALILLERFAGDPNQPGIARATALELLRPFGTSARKTLIAAAGDSDPLVRMAAAGAMEAFPPHERRLMLTPLLRDSLRAVRIEAARALAEIPETQFPTADAVARQKALAEYKKAQLLSAEQPVALLNLALIYEKTGQPDSAVGCYQWALQQDPQFLPAYFNLAHLLNQPGQNGAAEEILRNGIRHLPKEGRLHYSLGLILAEMNRLSEALPHLKEAADRLPVDAGVWYNYGLALQHLEQRPAAAEALRRAYQLAPANPRYVYALAVLYYQQGDWDPAAFFAEKWVEMAPEDRQAHQLLAKIRAKRSGH